ncbi:hypothetical protein DRQ50_06085 [bacterium]|nr:MAG: hypothetical protein DRQ50_06085 [bacterium]
MPLVLLLALLMAVATPQLVEVTPVEHLSVLDQGPPGGPPVVMIPGLSGCNYGFRKLMPLMHAEGLRTIAIEPLSIGLSDRTPEADYTLAAQAGRIATVLDQLAIEGAVIVSHGVATSMALRLALARPELVAGIVSVEGGANESASTPTVQRSLRLAKIVARMGGTRFLRDRYEDDLVKSSGDATWVDKRTVRNYFRGPGRDVQGTLNAFLAMSKQSEPAPLLPRLKDITIPVLVLWGNAEHEGAMDPEEKAMLTTELPQVELRVVPGAGHFIFEEQPQAVADAVIDLRQKLPANQE